MKKRFAYLQVGLIGALFLCCAILGTPLQAQRRVKWGKVGQKEAALSICAYDSSATALTLFHIGNIRFDYGKSAAHITHHRRVKILRSEGKEHGTVTIPFYSYEGREEVSMVSAQTLVQAPDGTWEAHEISKSEIYTKEYNDQWSLVTFAFPKVEPGCIIEYRYTLSTKNVYSLDAWTFQERLPVLYSSVSAAIGKGLEYRVLLSGRELKEKYNDDEARSFWELEDLPALRQEPHVFSTEAYQSFIRFQLAGYYKGGAMGGATYEEVSNSWETMVGEVLNDYRWASYLKAGGRHKKLVEMQVASFQSVSNRKALARLIFSGVQQHMKWNGKYGVFPAEQLADAWEAGTGNGAEVNGVLYALLEEAGLSPQLVMLSTRSHGSVFMDYPFLNEFNHHIVKLELSGEDVFLDAVNAWVPFGVLPVESRAITGLLLDKEKPKWVYPAASAPRAKLKARIIANVDAAGILSGVVAVRGTELFVPELQEHYANAIAQKPLSGVPWIKGIALDSAALTLSKASGDLGFQYGGVPLEGEGGYFYMTVPMLNAWWENPYPQMRRYLPVEQEFPYEISHTIVVNVPEGYKISAPESLALSLFDGVLTFSYRATTNGRQCVLQIKQVSTFFMIQPEGYSELEAFSKLATSKVLEQIVIEKE